VTSVKCSLPLGMSSLRKRRLPGFQPGAAGNATRRGTCRARASCPARGRRRDRRRHRNEGATRPPCDFGHVVVAGRTSEVLEVEFGFGGCHGTESGGGLLRDGRAGAGAPRAGPSPGAAGAGRDTAAIIASRRGSAVRRAERPGYTGARDRHEANTHSTFSLQGRL
jgi:hypothetical protein